MKEIRLVVKDVSQMGFLMNLLSRFDFIDIEQLPSNKRHNSEPTAYDFFESSGMWANRDIDAKTLRTNAWRRKS